MKFGINTLLWSAAYDHSVRARLPLIKEWGFDGVEVPVFRLPEFSASTLRRDMEANGLEYTICSVLLPGLSLIGDDASVRRKTVSHLRDTIKTVADAGASILAGPLYSPVGYLPGRRRTVDEWNWAVEGYQSLAPTLEENHVTLAIEPLNRFETFFLNTAADAAALCDAVGHPKVGILFDTFHANIEEKQIGAGYLTVGKHLLHVHTCENDRGTPGSGHVHWSETFDTLKETGYNGWMVIEAFGLALPEIAAATKIWRRMYKSEDQLASDGLAFMKRETTQRGMK